MLALNKINSKTSLGIEFLIVNLRHLFLFLNCSFFLFLNVSCLSREDRKSNDSFEAVPCLKGELSDNELFLNQINQNSSQQNIIGGKVVSPSTWLAKGVVLVFTKTTEGEPVSCTGSLISQDVILTAAHCFDKVNLGLVSGTNMGVFFSSQIGCNDPEVFNKSNIRRILEVNIHPNYKNKKDKYFTSKKIGDLALVRINAPAPKEWRPLTISNEYIDPTGIQILAAGYGQTTNYDIEDPSPLALRAVFLDTLKKETIQKIIETKIQDNELFGSIIASEKKSKEKIEKEYRIKYQTGPSREYFFVDQTENKGICSGDSGGASYVFQNGKIIIVGLASFVQNETSIEDGNACNQIGAYTNLYIYREWINSELLKTKAKLK